jgi:putative hydrolase of the HAD superfamily
MKYRHLFFDLDHTLWDFEANARLTLLDLHTNNQLHTKGVPDFELFFERYSYHNERLWDRYTKGSSNRMSCAGKGCGSHCLILN